MLDPFLGLRHPKQVCSEIGVGAPFVLPVRFREFAISPLNRLDAISYRFLHEVLISTRLRVHALRRVVCTSARGKPKLSQSALRRRTVNYTDYSRAKPAKGTGVYDKQ
jgi:hypothetical protein